MAAGAVSTSQVYNLHSVAGGLSGGVSFRNVTMHSDEWVCVRDTEDDQACIVLVNLRAGTDQRHRISADSAIMNPTEKILALKSGHTLQIFNMETRVKVKDLTSADPVAYWKWINTDMIALVTTEAVFHWSMKEGAKPKKIFKRNEQLDEATILNYCCDSNELWMFIIAVSKTNRLLEGKLQLYSAERQQSRQIEGHAACFIEKDGSTKVAVARTDEGLEGKLYVIGMPSANDPTPGGTLVTDIHMQTASDFPVALQASNELGIIFLVSRLGKLSLYEASTVTLLWSKDITADPIFTTIVTPDQSLLCIDTKGLVMKYSINKADMVSHIIEEHGAQDAAFAFAANAGVQGHDDLFQKRFDALLNAGDVPAAIKVAVESPGGLLRTQDTVRRLRDAPVQDGHPALSLYFKTLIEKDKLNDFESVELGRIVLARGGVEYMKKLSDENKLSDSEELGDLLHPTAPDMAMRVYFKAQAHPKVVTALIQRGDFAKVLPYCQRVDYKPEWLMLLMRIINTDPDNATELAIAIHQATAEGEKPAIDPNAFVDLLFQRSKFKEIVQYLDSVTARDTEEDGPLQTRLLEVALVNGSAQVGDSLLGRDKFHHFDLPKIGELCERVGLYQRALECYMLQNTRNSGGCLEDVRRVVVRTESISPEYIVDIFRNLSADASLQCLRTLLEASPQNFKICVQVCARFGDGLGTTRLIELFFDVRSWETLYFYLGGLVNTTDDKEVHFRFIEASTHTVHDGRIGWRSASLLTAGDIEANPGPTVSKEDIQGFLKAEKVKAEHHTTLIDTLWEKLHQCVDAFDSDLMDCDQVFKALQSTSWDSDKKPEQWWSQKSEPLCRLLRPRIQPTGAAAEGGAPGPTIQRASDFDTLVPPANQSCDPTYCHPYHVSSTWNLTQLEVGVQQAEDALNFEESRTARVIALVGGTGGGKTHALLHCPKMLKATHMVYITYNLDQCLTYDHRDPRLYTYFRLWLRLRGWTNCGCFRVFDTISLQVSSETMRDILVQEVKNLGQDSKLVILVDEVGLLEQKGASDVCSALGDLCAQLRDLGQGCTAIVTMLQDWTTTSSRPLQRWVLPQPTSDVWDFFIKKKPRTQEEVELLQSKLAGVAGLHIRSVVLVMQDEDNHTQTEVGELVQRVKTRLATHLSEEDKKRVRSYVEHCITRGGKTSSQDVQAFYTAAGIPPVIIADAYDYDHSVMAVLSSSQWGVKTTKQLELFAFAYDNFRWSRKLPFLPGDMQVCNAKQAPSWYKELEFTSFEVCKESIFTKFVALSPSHPHLRTLDGYGFPSDSSHPLIDRWCWTAHPRGDRCLVIFQDKINHNITDTFHSLGQAANTLSAVIQEEILCVAHVVCCPPEATPPDWFQFPYIIIGNENLKAFYSCFSPSVQLIIARHTAEETGRATRHRINQSTHAAGPPPGQGWGAAPSRGGSGITRGGGRSTRGGGRSTRGGGRSNRGGGFTWRERK